MGIDLFDRSSNEICFSINFWHWRAIVETVRREAILPEDTVDGLHSPFCGNGLTREECRLVAGHLKQHLIPGLSDEERILLDGTHTDEPDDGVFHKVDVEKNYSTNRAVLLRFIACLEDCEGFEVC